LQSSLQVGDFLAQRRDTLIALPVPQADGAVVLGVLW
jgi:hypothetical protein